VKIALGLLVVIAAIVAVSLLPIRQIDSPPFAHPAFQRTWNAQSASAARPIDLWGSDPLIWRIEPYAGAQDNRRTVQYFERARMELEQGSNQVTLGYLARELTTGTIELGDDQVLEQQPPEISIDGGERREEIPTYLTLSRFVDVPADDRTHNAEYVTQWINLAGSADPLTPPRAIRFARFIPDTGRNLPDVTVELFQRSQFSGDRWMDTLGLPISEPFWTYFRRGETLEPSLIQVFERNILVYSPQLEPDRRFTVANVGRHYYRWRYGTDLSGTRPPVDESNAVTKVVPQENYKAIIYAHDIGEPVDLALSSTGHLLILTADGRVLRSENPDPDGDPGNFRVWLDGMIDAEHMVSAGGYIYISTGDEDLVFRDRDGTGVRVFPSSEASQDLSALRQPELDPEGKAYAVHNGEQHNDAGLAIETPRGTFALDDSVVEVGPVVVSDQSVVVAGIGADGRSRIVQLLNSVTASQDPSLSSVMMLAPDLRIRAMIGNPDPSWAFTEYGSYFVAVAGADAGRVYALSLDEPGGATELREIATGFQQPVAMQFGLDGSLYVADAELGRVIRILPKQ
jgi:hypothetical protein